MRAVLAMIVVGCIVSGFTGCSDLGSAPPPDDDGWILPGDDAPRCQSDDACPSGSVCPRAGGCLPADQVYAVHVTWTLTGRPANRTTCSESRDLQIAFYTAADVTISYAPVPCHQGKFTVDKLPRSYVNVRLGKSHDSLQTAAIDPVTGDASFDLAF